METESVVQVCGTKLRVYKDSSHSNAHLHSSSQGLPAKRDRRLCGRERLAPNLMIKQFSVLLFLFHTRVSFLDLVSFHVLSQIKPQAPLLVVPWQIVEKTYSVYNSGGIPSSDLSSFYNKATKRDESVENTRSKTIFSQGEWVVKCIKGNFDNDYKT